MCLRSREGVFQFVPLPISCPHPGLWSSLELGEVGRKASLSMPMPCGFLHADFCVRIFLCGFFVQIFRAIFVCGFSRGIWIFCVRISVRILTQIFLGGLFGRETAGRATKKILQKILQKILKKILRKILPESLPGYLPGSPPLDSQNHGRTPGCPLPSPTPQYSLSGNIGQWLMQVLQVGVEDVEAEKDSALAKLEVWETQHALQVTKHAHGHLSGARCLSRLVSSTLAEPKKAKNITKKILTAAQRIPGGQTSEKLTSEKLLISLRDRPCMELITVSSNFQALLFLLDKLLELF